MLILDEPTRSLAPHEVAGPARRLRRRSSADGYAVVLIAHKLAEVLAAPIASRSCDAAGSSARWPRAEATEAALVSLMFEEPMREAASRRSSAVAAAGRRSWSCSGVSVRAEAHGAALTDVDLAVAPGEIVGVAGVSGNGQRELGDVILGVGRVRGRAQAPRRPGRHPRGRWRAMRAGGVAFVPEDALGLAAVPQLTRAGERGRRATGAATRGPAASRSTGPPRARTERAPSRGSASRCRRSTPRSARCPAATCSARCWRASWRTRRALIVALNPTRGLDARSTRGDPPRAAGGRGSRRRRAADLGGSRRAARARRSARGAVRRAHRRRRAPRRPRRRGDRSPHDGEPAR